MLTATQLDNWKIQIRHLMNGDRWCVACGTVSIPRSEPHYAVRCTGCFRDYMESQGKGRILKVFASMGAILPKYKDVRLSSRGMSKYCRTCGSQLEQDRVDYALRHSGGKRECLQCLSCSRGWTTPVRGLFIPTHWRNHTDELFPSES